MRSLWRQPSFTIAAVLALALGIGGTTAVLGILDAVLLRPMPFLHADRLFVPVGQNLSRGIPRATVCFADAEDWRREPGLFAELALWQPGNADLTGSVIPSASRLRSSTSSSFASSTSSR